MNEIAGCATVSEYTPSHEAVIQAFTEEQIPIMRKARLRKLAAECKHTCKDSCGHACCEAKRARQTAIERKRARALAVPQRRPEPIQATGNAHVNTGSQSADGRKEQDGDEVGRAGVEAGRKRKSASAAVGHTVDTETTVDFDNDSLSEQHTSKKAKTMQRAEPLFLPDHSDGIEDLEDENVDMPEEGAVLRNGLSDGIEDIEDAGPDNSHIAHEVGRSRPDQSAPVRPLFEGSCC